ncbi:MAG: G-D-S-L family lipolytic protein [Segetibacter sp.]|nr:G-D-S-L family lipolytic protein [Segetibacter sp.]
MEVKLLLFAAFVCSMLLMSYNYGKKKKKIIFFGDSITEQGVKPQGYITKLINLFKNDEENDKYELIGAGVGGNKVYDLYLRVDEDVLAKGPDVVVIFIGVNDVWHKQIHGLGTNAKDFETHYEILIKRLQVSTGKIIMCTPTVIGEKINGSNELDNELNKYSDIIRNIADSHNLPLVDLRQAFIAYNLANNPEDKQAGILTTDGVHLTETGNQLVAEEIYKVLSRLSNT